MLNHQSNYKILDLVGQGQFGRVFAAIERHSGNLVALKELKTKQLSTSSFLRELTFLVTLDHFNLVTCKALEHRRNQRYIVMDYCEGGTLRSLLNHSPSLTLNQSLKLVINILSGLQYAHEQGIIHRDLKPENILLKTSDRFYTAHIADFGIAKLKQEIDSQSILSNSGSPAYMAPEQFYGEYSYNCDLYGIGVILYELVSGNRPFLGMPKDLMVAHLSHAVTIDRNLPMLLRLAIAKSLEKLPQRRYQTATEMLQALELVQEVLEVDTSPKIPVRVEPEFVELLPASQINLDAPVSQVEMTGEQIYLVSGDRLIIKQHQDTNKSGAIFSERSKIFNQPIRNLQLSSTGCLIITSSAIYYSSGDSDLANLLPLAAFENDQFVATINPQGSWWAVASLNENSGKYNLKISKLPNSNSKLQRSLVDNQVCHHLKALDQKYGLSIHQDQGHNSEFRLFNRRGHWLANFTVQIRLESVIDHPFFPDLLLATEVDNSTMVILITLAKLNNVQTAPESPKRYAENRIRGTFNLKRIPVEISPIIIKPCPQGFLISDRQGKMILFAQNCDWIERFQIPLSPGFTVTAIAVSASELIVASTSSLPDTKVVQSQLQTFTLP